MQTTIRVTAVQLLGGIDHHHVIAVRWSSEETEETGDSTVEEVIDWLSQGPHVAWVGERDQVATLQVVHGLQASWLQANRMGELSRELLDLPRRRLTPQAEALDQRRR
jgi:hypothetical protein